MRADHISNWQIGRQATMIMGVWGFFAVFNVLNIYISAEISGAPHTLHNAVGFPIVQYGMLALSTLPILYFTKYVENTIKSRPVWISAHVGGALLLMAADATGWVLVPAWIRPDLAHSPNIFAKYEKSFVAMMEWNFWLYWTVVGIAYGVQYYYEMHDARVRAAELERELVEAQLQTLKQQLRPHFLFNTLNAISALIHTDTRAADDMIGNLSALLRFSVDSCNVQCVPLKDELSTLQLYLDIQQARFGSRFTVDMRIDPRTLEAYVPHLILQPLVENAFNHGIAKRAAGGRLCIHAESIENNMVRLRVMDNGPGSGGNATHCKGIGLSNTQARLRTLHGKVAKLTIDDSAKGFTVEAVFPFVNVMGKLV
jgi:two-component system, LytTR family, sensor kinase